MLRSECSKLNDVQFPEFMGDRCFMVKFYKDSGLPEKLGRFQETVDMMLKNVNTIINGVSQPIFLTIDEGIVKKGNTHRNGGVHIDGYWNEDMHCWGGGGWGGTPSSGWGTSGWKVKGNFLVPESIILASSVSASRGYIGEYENNIGDKGDCTHLDLSGLDCFLMEENRAYRGNVTFLHESLPVLFDTERTLVRLNIKNC